MMLLFAALVIMFDADRGTFWDLVVVLTVLLLLLLFRTFEEAARVVRETRAFVFAVATFCFEGAIVATAL